MEPMIVEITVDQNATIRLFINASWSAELLKAFT